MTRLLRTSVLVIVLLTDTTATWAVDYKAIILHPEGFYDSFAYSISSDQQVGEGWIPGSSGDHALLWSGTANSVVDLHPSGFERSSASGISGAQQVGNGRGSATGGPDHALMWTGSPESVVDLHPSGFSASVAYDVSGSQQVGYGVISTEIHALLWFGTAENYVDLNPSGFYESRAFDIENGQQVGYGRGIATNYERHALLWSGSAESVIDLHPTGFESSRGHRMSDGQQVGYGLASADREYHALLWSGTAESVVDLHPSGFERSGAYGVVCAQQVGYGYGSPTGGDRHALLWSGTASSVVDLHSYLGAEYYFSQAYDIDSNGAIVGFGLTYNGWRAVMWIPLIYVEIDIKPGSYPNSINLGNEGVIPVAILSSWEFDATTVDPATVELAGAGVELRGKSDKAMAHREDVNKDGLIDLVIQITTENLEPGYFQDGYATLTGKTYDGLFIEGSDEINIVPK